MSDDNGKDALNALGARLNAAKKEHIDPTRIPTEPGSQKGNALGLAFRVGVELVSAIMVGTAIGWALDYWLDTQPWLMLVFLVLGGAAGIMNVYRMAKGFGYAPGYSKNNSDADDDNRSSGD